jgi:SAM-dependent methyltransferase
MANAPARDVQAARITWEDAVRSLIDDPARRDLVEACYFDPPLAAAALRYHASAEWAAMRELIGQGAGRVAVDIGAGNGIVSHALARDGWAAVAVEPDPSELVGAAAIRSLAAETGCRIDVREGFGEGLPLADGEADLVVARQVLHHARDLPAFAREIARVLKPGGILVSTRDHVITGPGQLQAFLDAHPLHRFYGGENAFTVTQYRAAFTSAGLTIERQFDAFDSVINYAPQTPDTIRTALSAKFGPFGGAVRAALAPVPVFRLAMRVLSAIDRRPGRTISFLCRRS